MSRWIDVAIFDLDGVITDTAAVHAASWKRSFDEFLAARTPGASVRLFDAHDDYLRYVDGKSRADGVRSFLKSRDIVLPLGTDADAGLDTVCGLGNRKDAAFLSSLAATGVPVFPSSRPCLERLRAFGIRCGVASSSRNCRRVLAAAGLHGLFETTVDGSDLAALRLPGKPAPDLFLRSAATLDAAPDRCAVIEDSVAGVEAARRGGFNLVVGVDRTGIRSCLIAAGADHVVCDLDELTPQALTEWSRPSSFASSRRTSRPSRPDRSSAALPRR
jgi:beta-phosphoglucomutase family hydrolase